MAYIPTPGPTYYCEKCNCYSSFSSCGISNCKLAPMSVYANEKLPQPDVEIQQNKEINYKYAEDKILVDFKTYLNKTYGEHYKTEDQSIEAFDAWIALGDATPTFRNTALKYLWRYGKKNGNSKNDLFKALHYTLMCLYNDHYKEKICNGNKN
jgi:Protein of unknwon function (DUF3310)